MLIYKDIYVKKKSKHYGSRVIRDRDVEEPNG